MSEATQAEASPQHDKDYTIVVNAEPKTAESRDVSYDQVVELAFPGELHDPNTTFTVTFRNAAGERHTGTMVEGDVVEVKKEGTVFSVTRTTKS
jgi:hypothetical protein